MLTINFHQLLRKIKVYSNQRDVINVKVIKEEFYLRKKILNQKHQFHFVPWNFMENTLKIPTNSEREINFYDFHELENDLQTMSFK